MTTQLMRLGQGGRAFWQQRVQGAVHAGFRKGPGAGGWGGPASTLGVQSRVPAVEATRAGVLGGSQSPRAFLGTVRGLALRPGSWDNQVLGGLPGRASPVPRSLG